MTGGIGVGKSTVCGIFKHLGVPVNDADKIAHTIVDTNEVILQEIINKFGPQYLTIDNKLNRKKLKQQIFADVKDRIWLEQLLHPLIAKEIVLYAKNISYPYCIIEIPLLIETGMQNIVDRILTVDCPVELQLERAAKRDQEHVDEVKTIVAIQITRTERLTLTNDIIENTADIQALIKRVEQLHHAYLSLAV